MNELSRIRDFIFMYLLVLSCCMRPYHCYARSYSLVKLFYAFSYSLVVVIHFLVQSRYMHSSLLYTNLSLSSLVYSIVALTDTFSHS